MRKKSKDYRCEDEPKFKVVAVQKVRLSFPSRFYPFSTDLTEDEAKLLAHALRQAAEELA